MRRLRSAGPLLAALLLAGCSNPPYPRGAIEKLYPEPPRPSLLQVQSGARTLQVAEVPGKGARRIVFIHGSPGDWQAWSHYLVAPELAGYGARIAIDRPGYGGSGHGDVMPDLRAQAQVIAGAIAALVPPGEQVIVVGHSLGGPLLGWLAIDHPELVCGGVMVAGSIAPELEAPRWYNHVAETWLAHWLAPPELIWSNHEILPLQKELRRLDVEWTRLTRPLVVVQGDKDELVNPRTADYAEQRIPRQYLTVRRVPDQGHFVLWDQPATVIEAIRSLRCAS